MTIYDRPYDFNEQRQFPVNMLALEGGDSLDVECTYENTTDRMVKFGESSLDELCFIGLYRFPLTNDSLVRALGTEPGENPIPGRVGQRDLHALQPRLQSGQMVCGTSIEGARGS